MHVCIHGAKLCVVLTALYWFQFIFIPRNTQHSPYSEILIIWTKILNLTCSFIPPVYDKFWMSTGFLVLSLRSLSVLLLPKNLSCIGDYVVQGEMIGENGKLSILDSVRNKNFVVPSAQRKFQNPWKFVSSAKTLLHLLCKENRNTVIGTWDYLACPSYDVVWWIHWPPEPISCFCSFWALLYYSCWAKPSFSFGNAEFCILVQSLKVVWHWNWITAASFLSGQWCCQMLIRIVSD